MDKIIIIFHVDYCHLHCVQKISVAWNQIEKREEEEEQYSSRKK